MLFNGIWPCQTWSRLSFQLYIIPTLTMFICCCPYTPMMIFHPQGESTCWILQMSLCQWSDVDACIILFSPIMWNIQLYIYTVILGKLAFFFNEMCVYVLTRLVHVCTCLLVWSSTTAVDKTWTASGLPEHFLIDWRKIVFKEKVEIKSYHSFQHLRWDGEFKSYTVMY